MKTCAENYFLFFLKPTLMILCFVSNCLYLRHSEFVNEFFFIIYLITFSLKPILFIILLIGSLINYKIKTLIEGLLTLIIVGGIFFGFPVKEISDFYKISATTKFFMHLGEDYALDEYITTHYIVNILVENIPIALFVSINNLMLENKFSKNGIVDPIVTNTAFILLNGLIICVFYDK
jgi:hypothetical protein